MPDLVELLTSFNRKERFFLISQTLGNFQMSADFLRDLGEELGLTIPQTAFLAMDYHLEWLIAALHAWGSDDVNRIFDNQHQQIVKGNQEDSDLLIAFRAGQEYHIVLVEAKGATGWTNKQMLSKAERLGRIFGSEGSRYAGVVPHFCLMSPRRPQQLRANEWPSWMSKDDGSYIWLKLHFPKDTRMVTRCDANGRRSAEGNHFRIIGA